MVSTTYSNTAGLGKKLKIFKHLLGVAVAPTPLALCRGTRPPQWLPNLQILNL
jgi:hypothetical protein